MGLFGKIDEKKNAELMAPQYLRILEDCINLVNSTVSPDVFFSRYDLMLETLKKLSDMERYIKFKGSKPSADLLRLTAEREHFTNIFIERAFDKAMQDINKLKTPKGKLNKLNFWVDSMQEFNRYLSPENQLKLASTIDTYKASSL